MCVGKSRYNIIQRGGEREKEKKPVSVRTVTTESIREGGVESSAATTTEASSDRARARARAHHRRHYFCRLYAAFALIVVHAACAPLSRGYTPYAKCRARKYNTIIIVIIVVIVI